MEQPPGESDSIETTARRELAEEVTAVHWLSAEEIFDHDAAPAFLERDVERLERRR